MLSHSEEGCLSKSNTAHLAFCQIFQKAKLKTAHDAYRNFELQPNNACKSQ